MVEEVTKGQEQQVGTMNSEAIVECVPNYSEGTDLSKVSRIVHAMETPGVSLLDWSLDMAHNRSVVTIAGSPEAVRRDSARRPDVGGPDLHETAGASVVGARSFLIA